MFKAVALDVEQLLSSLRRHGTIESEDEVFTINLSRSRRYLAGNQSATPHRFLVSAVAGAFRAGAERVDIRPTAAGYFVSAPGAGLAERCLSEGMRGLPASDGAPGAFDLVTALRQALQCQCSRAVVRGTRAGSPGFCWQITPDDESRTQLAESPRDSLEMEFDFPPLSLWKRVVPSTMYRPEVGLLRDLCRLSIKPLTFDGKSLTGPRTAPKGRYTVSLGPFDAPPPHGDFEADLGLAAGTVYLVVDGVQSAALDDLGLNGVVWHDSLERDLSREGVAQDWRFQQLLAQLSGARLELLKRALLGGSFLNEREMIESLDFLYFHWLVGGDSFLRERLALWLGQKHGLGSKLSDVSLLTAYCGLAARLSETDWLPDLKVVILQVQWALQNQSKDVRDIILVALEFMRNNEEWEPTLLRAYLYLGLGAYDSIYGNQPDADRWFNRARAVVGNHKVAKELVAAHLRYPARHLLLEVWKALRKYAAA